MELEEALDEELELRRDRRLRLDLSRPGKEGEEDVEEMNTWVIYRL